MATIRSIRLVTGLVLFAWVATHLLNLAVGLVSLETMDAWRRVFLAPWQNPAGLAALYGSALVHMLLGFHALYRRRTLRMSGFESVQLLMALALPPLLVIHVVATRGLASTVGFEPSYTWLMVVYWKWLPLAGLRQVAVVVVAWIHGCMGLYYWMRLQAWWPRFAGVLYPAALLVPVAALLGFVEAGKEALVLAADPEWLDALRAAAGTAIAPRSEAWVYETQDVFLAGYGAALAAVLAARALRLRRGVPRERVRITYVDGPVVEARPGLSILEASRANYVSHASVCGGKARCGTCRVHVVAGLESLTPAGPMEAETLARVGAGPRVRLACQAVLRGGAITARRLVAPDIEADEIEDAAVGAGAEVRT